MFAYDICAGTTVNRLTFNLSSTCFLVQPFGVTLLYNVERSIDKDLEKGQISLLMEFASYLPVCAVGGYESSDRNTACVCE